MNMKHIHWTRILDICVASLLVAGGLNWGLIGLFHVDLIGEICGGMEFGETNLSSRLIYCLIGAAAGFSCYQVFSLKRLGLRWHIPRHETSQIKSSTLQRNFIELPLSALPQEGSNAKHTSLQNDFIRLPLNFPTHVAPEATE